jgi:hypothetical protein
MTDRAGKRRVDHQVLALRLEPEHRPQEQQRRPGRPGLRAAGGRVLHRVHRLGALVAAESLGQATVEELGGIEDSCRDHRGLVLESVPAQPPGDKRVVERPDRADVVADRVVASFALGQRAHPPTGEEPRPEQIPRDGLRLRLVDDAAPEEMAVVRGERVDLPPVGVEREREVFAVLDPEVSVEAPLQISRFLLEPVGESRVLPDEPCQARAAELRVVRVPLQLASRARKAGKPSR